MTVPLNAGYRASGPLKQSIGVVRNCEIRHRTPAAGVQNRSYPISFLTMTLDKQSTIQKALEIVWVAKARGESLDEVQA